MSEVLSEQDELRIHIERLRAMLEMLIVRGLRACGADELAHLKSHTQHLEQSGAGHVASILNSLHEQIEKDDRAAARTLLHAQTAVRLLERLLTLRMVRAQFAHAMQRGTDAEQDDEPEQEPGEDEE